MKTYEKYKDSGIEWIGEIPEHWEVKRLKRFAKICNGQDHKSVYDLSGDYPILGSGGEFGRANKFLHQGPSVLLGRKGTIDKPQYVDSPFWSVDTAYYTDIFPKTDLRFFYYLCTNIQFDLYKYGSAVPSMNQETLSQIEFPSPSYSEQTTIATYLDRKTAEIDRIIANKQKLIALYEEEKQAIINQAVTKGLDPTVKLKESGVEWLGEIPEHWEVKQLRNVVQMKSGEGITSENIKENGEYPVYGGNGLRGYFDNYTHIGDYVLIGRQGALCGNINYATGYFWASEHAIVCTLKGKSNTKWFGELLRIMNLNQYSVSAAQPGLSVENLKALKIPVPQLNEQKTIVAHIEKECARLDAIISKFNKQIDLLQEYRTTLISDVVMGKVRVTE